MKGLALSEHYYRECGKMIFESEFGALMDRVAVGLAGPGSECLGFDDDFSRDHDWGPGFCLWLTANDFKTYGKQFLACYHSLPKTFKDFGPRQVSQGEANRVGPMAIPDFYLKYTGLSQVPRTLSQWNIPASNLNLCTNGKVFADPLGEFTGWRKGLLDFYPEDLRLKKIADCCMHAGQAGQYNWQRGIFRKDPFVISTAKVSFCTRVIKLVYLLNKAYAPYFKWLLKGVKQLPVLGADIGAMVEKILARDNEFSFDKQNWEAAQARMTRVCETIIMELQHQGLTHKNGSFLIDHVPSILSRITDAEFKNRLWGGQS